MGSKPDMVETNCKCPDCGIVHRKEIYESDLRHTFPDLPKKMCIECERNWERQYQDWKYQLEHFSREAAEQWEKDNPFVYKAIQ